MQIHFLRHATFLLDYQGQKILVDPMLSDAGAMDPVPDVANPSRNPLVALPLRPEALACPDAVLLTHTHRDHFDEVAEKVLGRRVAILCQAPDSKALAAKGFEDVRPVADTLQWQEISLIRTGGQHGTGSIGQKMAPVSGYVLAARDEPGLYIVGDSIWCPEVESALEQYRPRVVICFAGAARFKVGDPITMSKEDVYQVCLKAPGAQVVAVHMEAWNHCTLSRQELARYAREKGVADRIIIPANGDRLVFEI